MIEPHGSTRTTVKTRYAVLTPDSFVPSQLPGLEKCRLRGHSSPAAGALFTQMLVTLKQRRLGEGNTGVNQYFVYTVEGAAASWSMSDARVSNGKLRLSASRHRHPDQKRGCEPAIAGYQKRYEAMPGTRPPARGGAMNATSRAMAFHGDVDAHVQVLPAR